MPTPTYDNPFTQGRDALWAQLEARTGFTNLVKVGNRIKNVAKLGLAPADTPQVVIVPAPGGSIDLFQTSSSSRFVQVYTIAVATRHISPDEFLQIKWEVIKAFAAAKDNLGLPDLITKARFGDGSEGLSEEQLLAGWAGVMSASIEFRYPTIQLTQ